MHRSNNCSGTKRAAVAAANAAPDAAAGAAARPRTEQSKKTGYQSPLQVLIRCLHIWRMLTRPD